jgi:hypothetical protein
MASIAIAPAHRPRVLLKNAVQRFVERNLGGSVSPFLAYLSEAGKVSDEQLRELEEIVARLSADQGRDAEREPDAGHRKNTHKRRDR